MLVNCKPGCKGKKVTTSASLDPDQDEAVCTSCYEVIPVSKFVKITMKQQGDLLNRDNRKSFQFNCLSCKKKTQTMLHDSKLVGVGCSGDCKFNVTKFTMLAMKSVSNQKDSVEPADNIDQSEDME